MSEVDKTEVLTLSINDLHRMKLEFYEQYETLFDDATIKLRRTWISKLRAMKSCAAQFKRFNQEDKKKRNSFNINQVDEDNSPRPKARTYSIKTVDLAQIDEKSFDSSSDSDI